MVLKEIGFYQSETLAAYARAACIAWSFTVLYARLQRKGMDCRTGELIQMQHSCHHGDTVCHPNSSYITTELYGTSACGCNNTVIQPELFSRFLPSTHVGRVGLAAVRPR